MGQGVFDIESICFRIRYKITHLLLDSSVGLVVNSPFWGDYI